MKTVSKSTISRLFGRFGHPHAMADSHGFLQARVTLFARAIFAFLLLFTLIGAVKLWVLSRSDIVELTRGNWIALLLLAGSTIGIGLDMLFLSRRRLPLWALHVYDSVGTLWMSAFFAILGPMVANRLGYVFSAFAVVLLLVLRAAIVPSSVPLTVLVGLLASVLVGVVPLWRDTPPPPAGYEIEEYLWLAAVAWCVIFTMASAVVSHVIYGLQRSVRKALQLGQYTLEQKMGEGGMGAVYLARHALLRRPTAVKVLDPAKAGRASVERFEREVQETCRLSHPNTIDIYDYGYTPEGVFYYAMEYLEGPDLEQLVTRFGHVSPERVVHLLAQVAHALAEAHGVGLVHRDIKPANIVVCEKGGVADVAKVLDFGLVKQVDAPNSAKLSTAQTLAGTPLYMAPEAISEPESADGRADLYSLGCVAWFLLVGESPFTGKNVVEVCSKHLYEDPGRLGEVAGTLLSAELEALVARCLAKKPAERFGSALELRKALRGCPEATQWSAEQAEQWWNEHRAEVHELRGHHDAGGSGTTATIAVDVERRLAHLA